MQTSLSGSGAFRLTQEDRTIDQRKLKPITAISLHTEHQLCMSVCVQRRDSTHSSRLRQTGGGRGRIHRPSSESPARSTS